jgi:CRP/FNR family transcriptional regulator
MVIYDGQTRCNQFVLLLSGTVRVYHVAPDGREMTMYRIEPGDLCVLSLTSLMNNIHYNVIAKSDTDIKALGISKEDFNQSLAESEKFRNFVISTLSGRLCDLMFLIQDTAFQTIQVRLACLLVKMFAMANTSTVATTHQNLAHEIGTSREVISRILKEFEHDNCIRITRGHIELLSLSRLDRHAHPEKHHCC